MTRKEFRNLVIESEEGEELVFEIEEQEHTRLRQVVAEAKSLGFDVNLWTRRINRSRRKAIFTKIKNGDVDRLKQKCKQHGNDKDKKREV